MRYIELNPERAGIVIDPVDYPCSSYHCNIPGQTNDLVALPQNTWLQVSRTKCVRRAISTYSSISFLKTASCLEFNRSSMHEELQPAIQFTITNRLTQMLDFYVI